MAMTPTSCARNVQNAQSRRMTGPHAADVRAMYDGGTSTAVVSAMTKKAPSGVMGGRPAAARPAHSTARLRA